MNRAKVRNLGICLISSLCMFTTSPAFAARPKNASDDTVYIKVRSTTMRIEPKPWAKGIAPLSYGSAITSLGEENGWVRVQDSKGKQGFIHISALSTEDVKLKKLASHTTTGDQEDVALAGKGFSADVEKQYAAKDRSLNFRDVDRMEQIKITPTEMAQFIASGKLGAEG